MVTTNTTLNYSSVVFNERSTTGSFVQSTTRSTTPSTTISTSPTTLSTAPVWSSSSAYPSKVWALACVASGSDIYCVGGLTGANTITNVANAVYYAPLSSSGVGQWTSTTSYPVGIRSQSCVTSASKIYCIGGFTSSAISNAVYYAPLSSSGVGQWTSTTSFPVPVWTQSCAASDSGIYCVGGITTSQTTSSAVYYAPFSSSGVGQWTNTTSYPVNVIEQECVTSSSDLFCIGGRASNAVYYAPLSSSGVDQWTSTTHYPFQVGPNSASCVTLGGEVYCVGGFAGATISNAVYHVPLSSSGVGQWMPSTSYPASVWGESCVASGNGIYCVGGNTAAGTALLDAVYYFERSP